MRNFLTASSIVIGTTLAGCSQSPESHQKYVEQINQSGIDQAERNGFTKLIQEHTQGKVELIFCTGEQYSNPQKVYKKNPDGNYTVFEASKIFRSDDVFTNINPLSPEPSIPRPFWINTGTPKETTEAKCK